MIGILYIIIWIIIWCIYIYPMIIYNDWAHLISSHLAVQHLQTLLIAFHCHSPFCQLVSSHLISAHLFEVIPPGASHLTSNPFSSLLFSTHLISHHLFFSLIICSHLSHVSLLFYVSCENDAFVRDFLQKANLNSSQLTLTSSQLISCQLISTQLNSSDGDGGSE